MIPSSSLALERFDMQRSQVFGKDGAKSIIVRVPDDARTAQTYQVVRVSISTTTSIHLGWCQPKRLNRQDSAQQGMDAHISISSITRSFYCDSVLWASIVGGIQSPIHGMSTSSTGSHFSTALTLYLGPTTADESTISIALFSTHAPPTPSCMLSPRLVCQNNRSFSDFMPPPELHSPSARLVVYVQQPTASSSRRLRNRLSRVCHSRPSRANSFRIRASFFVAPWLRTPYPRPSR